jgi:hypothetical protein
MHFCRAGRRPFAFILFCVALAVAIQPVLGFRGEEASGNFANKTKTRAGGVIGSSTLGLGQLPEGDVLRQDWQGFIAGQNGGWKVWIDPRTDMPSLVQGEGIAWAPGGGNSLQGPPASMEALEEVARQFFDEHPNLLGKWGGELVLDEDASMRLNDRVWHLSFAQEVDGVRVDGARYVFDVALGNLVSFGARRFAPVRVSAQPTLSVSEASTKLDEYLGLDNRDGMIELDSGTLQLVPVDPAEADGGPWTGFRGEGLAHRLIWRFEFQQPGAVELWVGEIDAHDGTVFAFYDDARYEQVRGDVNPITDDGDCANGGCQELGFPMPHTNVSEDGGPDVITNDFGLYTCTNGSTIETNLDGQYMYIDDVCGPVAETSICDDELSMGGSSGNTNCASAVGASVGNTDAARSAYFSTSRVMQKARYWLPGNSWLNGNSGKIRIRSNVNSTCNASWGGNTMNMYRRGNGCGNTGQNQGVVTHEWGHGFDQNDGGGFDNSSESYADVVAIFELRGSCVGPGFYADGRTCSGYGDTCLTCTGIRDHDWDARQAHTPATPANFTQPNCGSGSGPCGRAVHCESYVTSESVYDFATRDLPAGGLDAETSWQVAERLWYQSRGGSGGDIITCSLPNADSCDAGTWYQQMRVADDDDGNLANGTPHAAELFAAFDRHEIACGTAADAENQSTSSCPTLDTPVVTYTAKTNSVELSWSAVANAGGYRIYRNEIGCDHGQYPIAEVDGSTTSYVDDGLINDFTVYYRVQAIGTNSACESAVSTCTATAAQPLAGRLTFDQGSYGCNNLMNLKVTDANHGQPTMTVTLWSDSEPTPETVTLTEQSVGSSKYLGTLTTTSDPAAADGQLSIADGDTITGEYVDADDGNGNFNVPVQTSVVADCVFPVITGVDEQNITGSSARILWDTNEISSTLVEWGETQSLGNAESGADRVTVHEVQLSGLQECTTYYYNVQSTDPAGNVAVDDNGGALFRFETLGDLGQGLQPCHAGVVSVLGAIKSCNDSATIELTDIDLNADPGVVETINVDITSTTETTPETLVLTETGANTSVFTAVIQTAPAPAIPGDGIIQTADGDVLTATYNDVDDGSGNPAVSFDTATLDCGGPQISNVNVGGITNARVSLSWNTSEGADSVIEWGPTPALGQVTTQGGLRTAHSQLLNQFQACEQVYFRIKGTDTHGNTTIADDNGQPFFFNTNEIPGLFELESFENGVNGWNLQGEWEVGAPQGLGGSTGPADPASAYNNTGVLGHDLSGLGGSPGDYEPSTNESARSPIYPATTWTNTKLIYHRRLNAGSGDTANLNLFINGVGRTIYTNTGQPVSETSFQTVEIDISAFADGAATVELEFDQNASASGNHSGWNVDDIIFKDGSLPNYGVCGGCGVAPSFAGATSAVDNDACGVSGVTVSWGAVPAWGSGGPGTFAIYRDTVPGFTPSPANLVASGVTGLSYNDVSAPSDTVLYYIVQAENDETCGSGPNNGGLTDGNTMAVQVSETSSVPVPGAVGGVIVDLIGDAHVRLEWSGAASATTYRIYRSTSPQPGTFGLLAETSELLFEDLGEGANQNDYFYQVRGVNACGNEGP